MTLHATPPDHQHTRADPDAGGAAGRMLSKGDVWFATGAEIADWWRSR